MAKYLVTGSTIVNDMLYADGSKKTGFLGGTLYTVNGIRRSSFRHASAESDT